MKIGKWQSGWQILVMIVYLTLGCCAKAVSKDIVLQLTNSSRYRWYLVNYTTSDPINIRPKSKVLVLPGDIKMINIHLQNLPEKWPQEKKEALVGHWKLIRERDLNQIKDEMDLYIISEHAKIQKWSCQTNQSLMACEINEKKSEIEMDVVIAAF